jgi:hypothetical protein
MDGWVDKMREPEGASSRPETIREYSLASWSAVAVTPLSERCCRSVPRFKPGSMFDVEILRNPYADACRSSAISSPVCLTV